MVRKITFVHILEYLKRCYQLGLSGLDDTFSRLWQKRIEAASSEWNKEPTVTLWRRLRDGTETTEEMPLYWAEMTVASIPECEPLVERAKIIRKRDEHV